MAERAVDETRAGMEYQLDEPRPAQQIRERMEGIIADIAGIYGSEGYNKELVTVLKCETRVLTAELYTLLWTRCYSVRMDMYAKRLERSIQMVGGGDYTKEEIADMLREDLELQPLPEKERNAR